MIELIFVIVILGILAAVAVPRLAATRDDANVARGATELATLISDVGSSFTAQGTMSTDYRTMTNVDLGTAVLDMNATGSVFPYSDCITITPTETVAGTGADGVMVNYTAAGASAVCIGIAQAAASITGFTAAAADSNETHVFGGTGVNFN
jgi:general secretion pathway protein G